MTRADLHTVNGAPVLRFERDLTHPVAKVWRAITEPGELAHWFPSAVELDPRPGGAMRFTFPDTAPVDTDWSGEVLEFDPPRVFAFRWNQDVLRFELLPTDTGCRLVFTQTLGGGPVGRLGAGRNAAGWDTCLANLTARLDDRPAAPPDADWATPILGYLRRFGLDAGEVTDTAEGHLIRFARDLVWQPVDAVWAALTAGADRVEVGAAAPVAAVCPGVAAGAVTEVRAPRELACQWRHAGEVAGEVRWRVEHDPRTGTRAEVTQTVPAALAAVLPGALAAWRAHLDAFLTALLTPHT